MEPVLDEDLAEPTAEEHSAGHALFENLEEDFSEEGSEGKGLEDPNVEEGLADQGIPDQRKQYHFQDLAGPTSEGHSAGQASPDQCPEEHRVREASAGLEEANLEESFAGRARAEEESLGEHGVGEAAAEQDLAEPTAEEHAAGHAPPKARLFEDLEDDFSEEGSERKGLEDPNVEEGLADQVTPDQGREHHLEDFAEEGSERQGPEDPNVEEGLADQVIPDQREEHHLQDLAEPTAEERSSGHASPDRGLEEDFAEEGSEGQGLEGPNVEEGLADQETPDQRREHHLQDFAEEGGERKGPENPIVEEGLADQVIPDQRKDRHLQDLAEPTAEEHSSGHVSPDQGLEGDFAEEGRESQGLEDTNVEEGLADQVPPDQREEHHLQDFAEEGSERQGLDDPNVEEGLADQVIPDQRGLAYQVIPDQRKEHPPQDFAEEGSERKGLENPNVEKCLADQVIPDQRKEHHLQDYLFDEDGLSDTMEVIDSDALFAERVSELLLPSVQSILKGPRSDGAARAGGLRKVDESPLADGLAAAAGGCARQETGEAQDPYPLTVEQILQNSSNEAHEDDADGGATHEADSNVVVKGRAGTDDPHLGLPASEQATAEGHAAEGSTVPQAAIDQAEAHAQPEAAGGGADGDQDNQEQNDYESDFEESLEDQESPDKKNVEEHHVEASPAHQESPDQKGMGGHPVEESPADQENLDQADIKEANADQTSTNLEGLDQNEMEETNVEQTSTNLEGLDQNEMEETNLEQTSTNLEGLDQNEMEETNVEQTSMNVEGLDQNEMEENNVEQTSMDQTAEDQLLDDQLGADLLSESGAVTEPPAEGVSPEDASPTAESAAVDLVEDQSVTDGHCMYPCSEDVDGQGQPITDHLTLESIGVAEPADPASLEDLRTGQAMQETLLIEQPFLDPMPLAATEHIIDVTSDGDPCGFTGDQASYRGDAASPAHESVAMSSADEAPRRVEAWSEDPGHPSHARDGVPVRRASGSSSPTDQLPALVGPDGQPLRSSAKAQSQASSSRRQSTDSMKGWGTSWSPGFPTDRQLARKVDSMLRDHEETRFRSQNRTAASKPGKSGSEKGHEASARKPEAGAANSPATGGTRRAQASAGDSPASGATRRSQAASGRVGTRPRHASTAGTTLPSLGASSSSPGLAQSEGGAPKKKKCEPAKIRHEDGRFTLRGVRSTSDLERYAKGVDLQSRKGIEVRAAFKTMRSSQHSAVVQETWSALYSLQASERSFDDWYTSAKDGARYRFR